MNSEFVQVIKKNTEFRVSADVKITYNHSASEFASLEEKYHISEIAGQSDLDKAFNLLAWVNKHIHHTGNYDNSDSQDALTLLELAYDREYGINCLAMSIILCECLLAVGVDARVMYMMPENAEDGDNHVVVEAYISDMDKWIMLDPTYGNYCMDSKGGILNLYEMRNLIVEEEEYCFADSMNYNGVKVDDLDDVKEYYAKNLFFLRCKSVQGYGSHREYGNMLEMAPVGFDVHKRMVENLQFRINTYGDFEVFRIWQKYEEGLENKYIDVEAIY